MNTASIQGEQTGMPFYKRVLVAISICIAYFVLSYFLIGFRPEQIFISGLFFVLYILSKGTRNFVLTLMPFIVFWVIFDYMKAFPNYRYNAVHIGDLYTLEKSLFHIHYQGQLLSWNEFWELHHYKALDLITGFFYLCWMPVPITFAAYLFVKNRQAAVQFCLCFLLVNFVGFIGYYGYPAAPPWYVHYHGMVFDPHTPGHVAGLKGFDDILGLPIFQGLYTKSSNVFAAMPSLHSAYVVVSVFFAFRKKVASGWKIFLVILMLGTWFAAVYTNHHYILDVFVGVIAAQVGLLLFKLFLLRSKIFKRFLNSYYRQVA